MSERDISIVLGELKGLKEGICKLEKYIEILSGKVEKINIKQAEDRGKAEVKVLDCEDRFDNRYIRVDDFDRYIRRFFNGQLSLRQKSWSVIKDVLYVLNFGVVAIIVFRPIIMKVLEIIVN